MELPGAGGVLHPEIQAGLLGADMLAAPTSGAAVNGTKGRTYHRRVLAGVLGQESTCNINREGQNSVRSVQALHVALRTSHVPRLFAVERL